MSFMTLQSVTSGVAFCFNRFITVIKEVAILFIPLSILRLFPKNRCYQLALSYFVICLYWANTVQSFSLLVILFILTFYLLILSIFDSDYFLLPDNLTYILFLVGLIINTTEYQLVPFHYAFYGFLVGAGLFYGVYLGGYLIYQKCVLGFGDVKLFSIIGIVCGVEKLPFILLLGSFLGIFLYLGIWCATRECVNKIPFGSCLAFSTLIILGC